MTHDKSLTDKDLEKFRRGFQEVGDLAEGYALWNLLYEFIPDYKRYSLLKGEINYTETNKTKNICPLLELLTIGNNIYLVFKYENSFLVTSNKKNIESVYDFSSLFKDLFEYIQKIIADYPAEKILLYTYNSFKEIPFIEMSEKLMKRKDIFYNKFSFEFTDHEAFQRIEALFDGLLTINDDFLSFLFVKYNRKAFTRMADLHKGFFDTLKSIRKEINIKAKKNPEFDSEKHYQKLLVERGLIEE